MASEVEQLCDVQSVAIIGGGITGLTAAYYLSVLIPNAKIVVYERSQDIGGWVRTANVQNTQHKDRIINFETGPRSLPPSGVQSLVALDLIGRLGISERVNRIPSSAPASKNKQLYYPDRLNMLPSSSLSVPGALCTLPVLSGVIPGVLGELFRSAKPPQGDESIASFTTRRFGKALTENVVSAMLHGAYGGDGHQLSINSYFPSMVRAEEKHGSVIWGMMRGSEELFQDAQLKHKLEKKTAAERKKMEGCGLWNFKEGMSCIVRALGKALETAPNVEVRKMATVKKLVCNPNCGTSIQIEASVLESENKLVEHTVSETFSHAISCVFAPHLFPLLPSATSPLELSQITAVTVLVVGLFWETPGLLPNEGMGYLLPTSVPHNPHHVIGVTFDSDLEGMSETCTKVSVLMGGHYWNTRTTFPDRVDAVRMAREALKEQIGLDNVPDAVNVSLNRNCLPQYTVGHGERLQKIHEALLKGFGGRLSVAGASYAGVGVVKCMRSAWEVVDRIVTEGGATGLEAFATGKNKWVQKVKD